MVGAESADQLPEVEQEQIKARINAAYAECYLPIDGLRAPWTAQKVGVRFPAKRTFPVTVADGGATLVCPEYFAEADPDGIYLGSPLKIGNHDLVSAEFDAGEDKIHLLDPVPVDDGPETALFYFSTAALPESAVVVDGDAYLAGFGVLAPMSGQRAELRFRGFAQPGDFNIPRNRTLRGALEEGRPLFYYADTTAFEGESVGRLRLSVYPLPDQDAVVRVKTFNAAIPLDEDGDVPQLPQSVVGSVLLPMAIYAYCSASRRYNGDNRTFLREASDEARLKLRTFMVKQRQTGRKMHVRAGYA